MLPLRAGPPASVMSIALRDIARAHPGQHGRIAGFDHHVPKGYVYFAMAFSVCVELPNMRMRKRAAKPAYLHAAYATQQNDAAARP